MGFYGELPSSVTPVFGDSLRMNLRVGLMWVVHLMACGWCAHVDFFETSGHSSDGPYIQRYPDDIWVRFGQI